VIGTFAVLQLTSNGPDVAAVVSARDDPAQTGVGSSSTTAAPRTGTTSTPAATAPKKTTTSRPPAAPPRTPTTSSVLGTTVGKTQPTRKPPARTTTTPASPATPSFKPTRNWAWAPVAGAEYYSVEFLRGGKAFYEATPTEARLTLPASVVFVPGAYRWVVRPGFGPKAASRLGPPVVNSGFTVS
jgi:hypothetical protein